MANRQNGQLLSQSLWAIFFILGCYFIWLASEFTVQFYDGFQYLNSAKAFAGYNSYYDFTRPPVFQFLLLPIMLLHRFTGSMFWLVRAPYFEMLLINAVAIITAWKLLRQGLSKELALILTALMLLN